MSAALAEEVKQLLLPYSAVHFTLCPYLDNLVTVANELVDHYSHNDSILGYAEAV